MSEPAPDEHNHPASMTKYPGDAIFGWTSSKKTGSIVFFGMLVVCALLVLASFVLPGRHEYIHMAEFAPCYALFGFGAFAFVVLTGWPLAKLLRRAENYYEAKETERD